ncbi:MAG: hypothetical protein IH627_00980 [Rubrivivax sp.]|nr:hypothetical protein [Rubrivivax sp.]
MNAIRMGLLKADGRGGYEEVRTAAGAQRTYSTVESERQEAHQAALAEVNEQQALTTAGVFNGDEDALWQTHISPIPEHAFRATAASMTNAVVLGQSFDTAASTLARATGMDREKAYEAIELAANLQDRIVSRAVAKVGVTGEHLETFYDHCRDNPGKLANALHYLLHGRDVSHFQTLAREYVARAERLDLQSHSAGTKGREAPRGPAVLNEDAFKAAGFQTSRTRQGVLMVKHGAGGRWVPAADVVGA